MSAKDTSFSGSELWAVSTIESSSCTPVIAAARRILSEKGALLFFLFFRDFLDFLSAVERDSGRSASCPSLSW